MSLARAKDIMTRVPVTVGAQASAGEAADKLVRLGIRHLPVVDADGVLVGILSDRDFGGLLTRAVGSSPRVGPDTPIEAFMSRDVATVGPDAPLAEVVDLLVERQVGAVPVVDSKEVVVGIISYLDVLEHVAQTL